MSPRRYEAPKRQSAREKVRRRIVEAVIKLHAQQGVTRTTYAKIAKRADVAIPTVYNHFPAMSDLLAACSGRVLADAPPLGSEIFAATTDLESRLKALVRAVCARHRHLTPWFRWTYYEARLVPEMTPRYRKAAEQRRDLIQEALAPAFGPQPPAPLVVVCECLLDFPAWQHMTEERGLSDGEAETALFTALTAVARAYAVAHEAEPRSSPSMHRRPS